MLLHYDAVSHPGVNLQTRVPVVLGVVWTFQALTLLIFGARILVKTKLRKLGGDDALIGTSVVRFYSVVPSWSAQC